VRLTGNPNQKFPEKIPVYVPIVPGAVFRWKEVHWTGNSVLSDFTLGGLLGAKSGDIANGMQMEEGWDRIREEYGHHGYLDAKLDPVVTYDDQAHTVSYAVAIQEGIPYNFGKIVLTDSPSRRNASSMPRGLSPPAISSISSNLKNFSSNCNPIVNRSSVNCPCTMKPWGIFSKRIGQAHRRRAFGFQVRPTVARSQLQLNVHSALYSPLR